MIRCTFFLSLVLVSTLMYGQVEYPNSSTMLTYRIAPASSDVSTAYSIEFSEAGSDAYKLAEKLGASLNKLLSPEQALLINNVELVNMLDEGVQLRVSLTSDNSETYTALFPVVQFDGWYQMGEQFNAVACKTLSCDETVVFTRSGCSCGGAPGQLSLINSSM